MRAKIRRFSRLKSEPRIEGKSAQYTLRHCGVVRCAPDGQIRIKVAEGVGYAEGVVHCGSVHCCPVCGAVIRTRRSVIYQDSAKRWLDDSNWVYMVTLTFPHYMGDDLARMWDLVSGGAGYLTSNRRWYKLRDELGCRPLPRPLFVADSVGEAERVTRWDECDIGYRRVIECTWGCENAFHPHCHMLVYLRNTEATDALDGAERLAKITAHFWQSWLRWVTHTCKDCGKAIRAGRGCPFARRSRLVVRSEVPCGCRCECGGPGYPPPSAGYGAKVEQCYAADKAAEYLVKTQDGKGVGMELARGDLKKGRKDSLTPFEIADRAGDGEEQFLKLWWTWEKASKGRKMTTESQGLARMLGEVEITDQELADEDAGGEEVAAVTGQTWANACAHRCADAGRNPAAARNGLEAAVFEAAVAGGLAGVNEVLHAHGCGWAYVPPPREEGG